LPDPRGTLRGALRGASGSYGDPVRPPQTPVSLDELGGRALRRPPPVIAPENPVSCGRLFRGRDFVAAALRVDSLAVKAACDT